MRFGFLCAALAAITVACSGSHKDSVGGDDQHITGGAPAPVPSPPGAQIVPANQPNKLGDADRLASELIMRTVLAGKMLPASKIDETDGNKILRRALEGSGDDPQTVTLMSLSCDNAGITKKCRIELGIELKNPGPNDDHGFSSVFGLDVDILFGTISQAKFDLLAG